MKLNGRGQLRVEARDVVAAAVVENVVGCCRRIDGRDLTVFGLLEDRLLDLLMLLLLLVVLLNIMLLFLDNVLIESDHELIQQFGVVQIDGRKLLLLLLGLLHLLLLLHLNERGQVAGGGLMMDRLCVVGLLWNRWEREDTVVVIVVAAIVGMLAGEVVVWMPQDVVVIVVVDVGGREGSVGHAAEDVFREERSRTQADGRIRVGRRGIVRRCGRRRRRGRETGKRQRRRHTERSAAETSTGGGRHHSRWHGNRRGNSVMELWLLLLLWELLLRLRLHGNIGLNLRRGGGSARDGRPATLFGVVDEVASGAVRAETGSVKCAA